MDKKKIIRVLIAKSGMDGHVRGSIVVGMALRDAGMEVIFSGLYQTPKQIVETAIQEDVDVIGLSILCGSQLPICRGIIKLLKEKQAQDIQVVVGGIIPEKDFEELLSMGVSKIFTPGTSTDIIIQEIQQMVHTKGLSGVLS
jgi:methylmalonyl-CoA mutase C-terminal domain/subunit